jgi:hypothetical protein
MSAMRTYRRAALALAGAGAVVTALLIDPRTLIAVYLATVVVVSAIAVGACAVLMITYLVRGRWTEGLHLPLTAAALTTPLAGLMFIPVLLGMAWLYPWVHAPAGETGSFRALWLAPGFFVGRTVSYFVIWTVLAFWVRKAWADPGRMVVAASAGLMLYALTASLAGIDWLESLTPEFHSSLYGLLFLTFQIVSGYAFVLTIALSRPGAPTFRYGAILFAALLMWAYNHAMHYIIIWSGDVPDEVIWYLRRETGGWGVVMWSLMTLQFIVPFFALLSERVRNRREPLLAIAALTLALRFVEAYVLALPGRNLVGIALVFAIPGCALLIGLTWWIGFGLAFAHVTACTADTRPPPDGFDAAGNPVSPVRSTS